MTSAKYPYITQCRESRIGARVAGAIFVVGIAAAAALLFATPEIYTYAVQAGWVRP